MEEDKITISFSQYSAIDAVSLSGEEKGQLLISLCEYRFNGVSPINLSPTASVAFVFLRAAIDSEGQHKKEVSEKKRRAAAARWQCKDAHASVHDVQCKDAHASVHDVHKNESPSPTHLVDKLIDNLDSKITESIGDSNNYNNPYNNNSYKKEKEKNISLLEEEEEEEGKEKEKEKENFSTSTPSLLNDASWCEAMMMKHHITQKQLQAYLSDFELDQRCRGGTEHDSDRDLKQHFASWLMIRRKNEREEKQKNRNPLGLYDSQEKDYKAGGW